MIGKLSLKKSLIAGLGGAIGVLSLYHDSGDEVREDSSNDDMRVVCCSPLPGELEYDVCHETSALHAVGCVLRDAWKSTRNVEHQRISMTVMKTLSYLQQYVSLMAVCSDCCDKVHDRLHVLTKALAGSFFTRLMLEHASSGKASLEFREETSDYIACVMKDGDIAASFLSTPGNVERLFLALDDQDDLGERVWDSMEHVDEVPLHVSIRSKDVDVMLSNLGQFKQNEARRRIALRIFKWVCQRTAHGNGPIFDAAMMGKAIQCISTASNAVSGVDVSSKMDIVSSMRNMIDFMPSASVHRTLPWLWPLLCFAADGVGSEDWDLVNESLDCFTSCIEKGVHVSPDLIEKSALPLLYSIARDVPSTRLDVGVRIAECIGSLARTTSSISHAQKRRWAELFTSWLIRLDPREADLTRGTTIIEAKALSESLVDALTCLASKQGIEGVQIAHLWLADTIIHLSKMATPYSKVEKDVRVVPKEDVTKKRGNRLWYWPPFRWNTQKNVENEETLEDEAHAVADMAEKMLGPAVRESEGNRHEIDENREISQHVPWWKYYKIWMGQKEELNKEDEGEGVVRDSSVDASDPELALYINASPVGPIYARSVARRLLEASGNVFNVEPDLSQSIDDNMSPRTAAAYSAAAAAVNMEVADIAVGQALKVLSALASGNTDNRQWLLSAGVPRLLQIIAMNRGDREDSDRQLWDYGSLWQENMPLKLQRQISRLLAILSTELNGAESLVQHDFIPWLQTLAASRDCKISSNAAKALLHIEAAYKSGIFVSRIQNKNLLDPSRRLVKNDTGISNIGMRDTDHHSGKRMMNLGMEEKHNLSVKQKRAEMVWKNLSEDRMVLHDGVHLFTPLARHHEVLAQEGTSTKSDDAPEFDIVFVHGIRGGAFITWRKEKAFSRGGARGNLDHSICWPTSWLAPMFPKARILSAEYAAPATWWEGESLPLFATVNHLADRLTAAGIGSRPVVFVCHSMGGIVVKEIIGRGTQKDAPPSLRKISNAAAGLVFYSVPHAGSRLADLGWSLRYIGASPSRAVAHLKTDPHLHEMNSVIRDLCRRDKLNVLSFSEGLPTKLSYLSTHIVPHESAYPGYGEFVVLTEHDHITVCKPNDVNDPAFANLVQFLSEIEKKSCKK